MDGVWAGLAKWRLSVSKHGMGDCSTLPSCMKKEILVSDALGDFVSSDPAMSVSG